MSHTIRKYPGNLRRDGAVQLEKHLKRVDRYTGWTDDGIWTPEAKRRNKRKVSRENRHKLNAAIRYEDDDGAE